MARDESPDAAPGSVCPMLKENAETLLAYVERRLTPEAAGEIERHAERCAECGKVLRAQRALWEAMEAWEPEPVSADFNRRLYRAIEEDEALPWWRKAVGVALAARWNLAAPVAASCAILVGVFLTRTPDPMEEKKPAAMVEAVDVENLDRALDDLDLLRELDEQLREEPGAGSRI